MPGFENEPLQPSSLLAELFGTDLPGVFQLQGLASPRLTARPTGSIELGVGNYPPGMCGSSAFDDALCSLGEDPVTFMANPTADELLSAISMLSQQENDDPLSSGSATTDALQAFNFDECFDFGGSAPPAPSAPEPSPPPLARHQPWVPPRGATNAAGRRVGGSWKVPLAVSRLASGSPIPSCASSPKQAAV
ncbi:hypothetical protein EDB85DRAFT_2194232 [Lactarius pseudohatsudake]|nr:hypothetical protein EDB85DRAFT_2194232 [Lactarius pseudohatsudake]